MENKNELGNLVVKTEVPSCEELRSEEMIFIDEYIDYIYNKIPSAYISFIKRTLQEVAGDFVIKKKELVIREKEENFKIVEMYLRSKTISGKSPDTVGLYRIVLTDFVTYMQKPFNEVSSDNIRDYLTELKERRKLSDRSLELRRTCLNTFFSYLFNEAYIHRNPFSTVEKIKYEETEVNPFTPHEMELIRMNCTTERERAMVETFYSTGCRCGELREMKITDIDFSYKTIKVFGKGRVHRTVRINDKALIHIKRYVESRIDGTPYLFVSMRKPFNQLTNGGIEKIIKTIGERAGIEDAHPHRFRHTLATDCVNRGMEITSVQKILGHKKLETTMIYAKVSDDTIKSAYDKCVV